MSEVQERLLELYAKSGEAIYIEAADEIERLQRENEELREKASDEMYANARLEEELAEAQAKLQEVERDAARYRWLKKESQLPHGIRCFEVMRGESNMWEVLISKQLDAAIDQAMEQSK